MLALLGFLPILQALSCIATIWGVAHTSQVTDTVVQYGAGADGPSAQEWLNSYGSMAIGVAGWLFTHYFNKVKGVGSNELSVAVLGYFANPKDSATIRRLAFAVIDWIESTYVTNASDADKEWWGQMLSNMRTKFAEPAPLPVEPKG